MPSEITQRNTREQEIATLKARQKKLQSRMDKRDWKNPAQKQQLVSSLITVDRQLADLGALGAVDEAVKGAGEDGKRN